MKRNLYQSALIAALGFSAVTAANATSGTDLVIGFNDSVGPTSAQNDYVIDIGSFANLTTAANGGTVDLMSSGIINQSTFTSTFGTAYSSDSSYLNDVAVGVAGANTGSSPRDLWQTAPVGVTPGAIGTGSFNPASSVFGSLTLGKYASTTTTGWSALIAASPTAVGTAQNGGGNSESGSTGTNPMGQLSSGTLVLDLWQITETTGSRGTTGSWVEEGFFTFNLNTDDITYSVLGAAPEPGSYGVIAGVLLLGCVFGRRFLPMLKRANQ